MKKGQGLSINVVIIAVIAILVLVILVFLLGRTSGDFSDSTKCISAGGRCTTEPCQAKIIPGVPSPCGPTEQCCPIIS